MQFNDKKDRTICLQDSCNIIYAYNRGNEVGFIQFSVSEYPNKYGEGMYIAYPEQMHINENYQRSGIGTQIIEYAKEIYDEVKFAEDTGCGGNTNEIHYSSEGLEFKNYCEINGITENTLDYEGDEY